MIRIGIVGGIGSGKSYIAKNFGYPVFNADNEVNKIYKKNIKCYKKFKKKFPKDAISFPIKKKDLIKIIKNNKTNIKKINKIVHPEVKKSMKNFVRKYKKKKAIVLDIPLLLEEKIYNKKDVLIFIKADKKEVYKRLKKRKNFNEKIYKELKKLQLPLHFKKKNSIFSIKNDFKPFAVKKNIKLIKEEIFRK